MRLPVHIWLTERNANPDELAGYLVEIAKRMDASPERMCLIVDSTVPASLDIDPSDGNLVARISGAERRFSLRHRWLPEHPVPIEFGPALGGGRCRARTVRRRRTVLLIDPTDGNRFRVRTCRVFGIPALTYLAFAASASIAAVTFSRIAAALAIFLLVVMAVPRLFPRIYSRMADLFWICYCHVRFPA